MQTFSIVIHGGAGTILKEDMTPELERAYMKGLQDAVNAGYGVLEEGGAATNAVKAAIVILEDNLLFNAGRGSVFTKKGVQEMDAAIMDGKDLSAGAVAGVRNVRNPIELAAEVMHNSNHVFLSGKGANDFAIKQGIKLEPDEFFFSQFRYDQWKAYVTVIIIHSTIRIRASKNCLRIKNLVRLVLWHAIPTAILLRLPVPGG